MRKVSLLSSRIRSEADRMRRQSLKRTGLVVLAAILITLPVVGFFVARDTARSHRDRLVNAAVDDLHGVLQFDLVSNVREVEAVNAFYSAEDQQGIDPLEIKTKEFRVLASHIDQGKEFQALEFAPRVPRSELGMFTRLARGTVSPTYKVYEKGKNGRDQPVSGRSAYYPVYMLYPWKGNRVALGFDLGSERNRRSALEKAIRTGKSQSTRKIKLVQETGTSAAVLIFSPTYRGGVTPRTERARKSKVLGVVLGVLEIGEVVRHVTAQLKGDAEKLELAIYDSPRPAEESLLYSSTGPDPHLGSPLRNKKLEVAGRTWHLVAWPKAGAIEPAYGFSWFLLGSGLAVAILIILTILGMTRSQSMQRKKNHDLQEAEKRYRNLFDASPDGIGVADVEAREYRYVNPAYCRMFGYSAEEMRDKSLTAMHSEESLEHVMEEFEIAARGDKRIAANIPCRRKDGTIFYADIAAAPTTLGGRLMNAGFFRDITERKEAEEKIMEQTRLAEAASLAKSEFLANMSHELRTPLNSIIGFTELMHDGKTAPKDEYFEDILESGVHLLDLIEDVLDLSKIEAGKVEFRPELFDLAELVERIRDSVKVLAARKLIEIETEFDPDMGDVQIDPARFKQVLYNYLSNAVKFTPKGGRVRIRIVPENENEFRLEVEDSGIGIATQDQDRLFTEFTQLDQSRSKEYEGTGLGLALVKRLVEAQGGRVGVDSTPGKGSVFFAVLPRIYRVGESPKDGTAKSASTDGGAAAGATEKSDTSGKARRK